VQHDKLLHGIFVNDIVIICSA